MTSFSHVKRNDNVVAHALVKEANASNELQVWLEEVSNDLASYEVHNFSFFFLLK